MMFYEAFISELQKIGAASSMSMPFPGESNKSLRAGTKTTTVRVGAERGRYSPGSTYAATNYKGQSLGMRVKVLAVEKTPLSGVDALTRVGKAAIIQREHGTSLAEQVDVVRFEVVV